MLFTHDAGSLASRYFRGGERGEAGGIAQKLTVSRLKILLYEYQNPFIPASTTLPEAVRKPPDRPPGFLAACVCSRAHAYWTCGCRRGDEGGAILS